MIEEKPYRPNRVQDKVIDKHEKLLAIVGSRVEKRYGTGYNTFMNYYMVSLDSLVLFLNVLNIFISRFKQLFNNNNHIQMYSIEINVN